MTETKGKIKLAGVLESLYRTYNTRDYVDPDPLVFLYRYPDVREREIAGLIAALFAYGRVSQIMKTVGFILDTMGPSPRDYLLCSGLTDLARDFRGFKYRFTTAEHLVALMAGIRSILRGSGSLHACFLEGMVPGDSSILPALSRFIRNLQTCGDTGILTADPARNSACKRNHLFLRWMVRNDTVDPGGWHGISPSCLMVPLDTHMHRAGTLLGFTRRKQGDVRTAMEITRGFLELSPDDPVRYDFCLTRFGIRQEMTMEELGNLLNP